MRNENTEGPVERYPLHEAVLDLIETHFGTWWTADAIACRLSANPGSVRKAIQRAHFPASVISRANPDTGITEYQATCRAYLHEHSAA